MGNCCPKSSDDQVLLASNGGRVQAFQGQVRIEASRFRSRCHTSHDETPHPYRRFCNP
jgi:hypothetical protein